MLQMLMTLPIKNWRTIASFLLMDLQMKDDRIRTTAQPKSAHVQKRQ